MFSRFTRMTFLVVAASVLLAPMAMAKGPALDPSCAALQNSFRPAPEWYGERCRPNRPSSVSSQPTGNGFVPGDTAYFKTFFNPAIQTAPIPSLTFTSVGPNTLSMFGLSFNNAATILYGLDQDSRMLGTVDQTTGVFTPIAAINPDPGLFVTGLSNDPTSGLMYATLVDGAISNLYTIDVTTATLSLVGPITGFGLIIDIKVDAAGQMYGHDLSDVLIRIDKTTGAPTVVGPTGIDANFAQGMMYDFSDDTLYGCIFDNAAFATVMVTFDRATGAATVVAGPLGSEEAECAARVPTGPCTGPTFGGLVSATSAGTPACAVNLAWNAATACGPTTITYNVYRSTTPGVPPSAATLLQSCLTTTTFTDTTATGGTRYYYRVRAEDNTTGGSGDCNGGVTDTNNVERSAVPGGPITTVTDDVESGGANWSTAGGTGTNIWSIVTTQSNSPTRSWFWPDPDVVTLQPLTRTSAVTYPAGGGTWSWFHMLDSESTFDGMVAEYSLDGGTTWSDILLGQGTVPANPNRFLQNGYNSTLNTGFSNPLPGRRAWSGANGAFQEVRVDMADFAGRDVTIRYLAGSDDSVPVVGIWVDDISFGTVGACTTVPTVAVAPESLVVDFAGNRVYQPNETVIVEPTWRNTGATAVTLTGVLTNHTGPVGPVYTIPDGAASYGSIAVGATASCGTNCYSVANTATARPATHWDSTALETVTPTAATKTWTLHIGDSFTDVVAGTPFYRFIETILHNGVTGGCSATAYCPGNSTTREQMAVFVLVSREGTGYTPPACVAGSEAFTDVPATSPFCRWIEELFNRGVVGGCGTGIYCPTNPATREQMAVFVLRTLDPTLNPPACVAGSEQFADVPATSPFCRWIEELANRGVVTGCGGGNYCPTANVSREQMSVFLAVTFGLVLYGL